jgi:hypothetical protein
MGGRQGNKEVPHGSIGEHIFAEVEQLTAGGAMTRLAAFESIAQRTGGQAGTVAANYYRIARKRSVALRPRRAAGSGSTASTRAAIRTLGAAMQRIEFALKAKEKELLELRHENQRFAKLRKLMKD